MLRHTSIHTYNIPEETNLLLGYAVCACVRVWWTWPDTSLKHTRRRPAGVPAAPLFNTSAQCTQTQLPFPWSFCSCRSLGVPVMDTVSFYGRLLLTASLHSRTNSHFSMQRGGSSKPYNPNKLLNRQTKEEKVSEPSHFTIKRCRKTCVRLPTLNCSKSTADLLLTRAQQHTPWRKSFKAIVQIF